MFIENVWNDGILLISKRQRKDRNKNYFVLELHGLKRKKFIWWCWGRKMSYGLFHILYFRTCAGQRQICATAKQHPTILINIHILWSLSSRFMIRLQLVQNEHPMNFYIISRKGIRHKNVKLFLREHIVASYFWIWHRINNVSRETIK